MSPRPEVHGTAAGYQRGCRCDDCTAANTAKMRAFREARRGNPTPRHVPHGRRSTYVNHGCRCAACKRANRPEAGDERWSSLILG